MMDMNHEIMESMWLITISQPTIYFFNWVYNQPTKDKRTHCDPNYPKSFALISAKKQCGG